MPVSAHQPLTSPSSSDLTTQNNPDQVPSTVKNLLISTQRLQEVLRLWSVKQASEGDVSDMYVQIGNELNLTISAFALHQIDLSEMNSITGDLRTVLERCLSEEPSSEVLDTFMPEVRHVLFKLLRGLKTQHESWQTARRRPK